MKFNVYLRKDQERIAMAIFSTLWKSVKSLYLTHCRRLVSSIPGDLHTNIFKDILNQSLDCGGDEEGLHFIWPDYYQSEPKTFPGL